jgi:hypothetical protein
LVLVLLFLEEELLELPGVLGVGGLEGLQGLRDLSEVEGGGRWDGLREALELLGLEGGEFLLEGVRCVLNCFEQLLLICETF